MERKKKKLANSILGGGFKTKKAFTLIELLAIIVILAIIAVITVPIILNVIDNSKKGAVKDSAYGYKDAVNKYYITKLSEDSNLKLSGTYMVEEDGTIQGMNLDTKSYTDKLDISISGTIPTGGYLNYENNVLKDGCLTMDEYKITIENGEVTKAEKGACESVSLTACNSDNFDPSPEEWFNFDSTTGTIRGFSNSWDGTTAITIPCQIGEKNVVNIGQGAFAGKTLTSVVISDTVELIDQAAFTSNSNLTKLLLGKNVKTIGMASFSTCNLKELKIPDNVIYIKQAAFHNNKNLTSVELENGVEIIEVAAFRYCNLNEITIPNSVKEIQSSVFIKALNDPMGSSNQNLTTIYNNSGKSFDWGSIINETSGYTFETGTVINEAGNVEIIKLN